MCIISIFNVLEIKHIFIKITMFQTKPNLVKRVALFYSFANLFNIRLTEGS